MSKVAKLGIRLFTYDEQDGSSTNKVTFEALLYNPSCGVNVQSSQDLMRTVSGVVQIRRKRLTSSKIRIPAEE